MEVTKANLATYLAELTPSATPYPIEITETVASDWGTSFKSGTVGNIINTNTPNGVYLDLGLTIIPSSVTSLSYTFEGCTALTTAPIIPSSVTSLYFTFQGCTSLTTAPVIPNSVTDMNYTFRGCTLLHTIQNFAVDVDNCYMANAFQNCPALANIYVTTLSESSWHLLHTNTGATGTDYTIYNPDGTVAGSGTVAGTSQVLTLYGKSDELVISTNITPTRAKETATSQVQWHKSGLPYDDKLMIFNAKNPDTVISNFITVNRAGEEFLGNATTATTATQANAIKPLGNSITLPATSTSTTKIIKIASVNYEWAGTIKIRADGGGIADDVSLHFGQRADTSGIQVTYSKYHTYLGFYGINTIIVTQNEAGGGATRNIYIEHATYPNYAHTIILGVVETIAGVFTPSMTEVSSVAGTVIDSLSLSYQRGDISSYQHVFTKNIIGNLTGNATTASNGFINIRRSANFTLPTYSDGTHVSVANTHATNTITCTLPTGQTMNGQASFTIIAGKILELELIGSVWIDTNTDYYSTTEQVIGKWIDGKPLYRKVVNFGALPNTTVKLVAHGITNLGTVTRLSGVASYGTTYLTLPHVNSSNAIYSVSLSIAGNDVEIITGADRSNYKASKVIIEYTKTTD